MINPLVSILIPVYNRANMIADAIESALAQDYPNIEIIVVDNCSTDETFSICEKYAEVNKIRLFRNDENIGAIPNFIKCCSYAKGQYVKFLLSDDRDAPSFISKAVKLMDKNVSFVIAGVANGKVYTTWGSQSGSIPAMRYMNDIIYFGGSAGSPGNVLFRRLDVDRNFRPTIKLQENACMECRGAGPDLMLLLETANQYERVGVIPEVLSFFGAPADSISIKFAKENEHSYRTCYNLAKFDFITRFPSTFNQQKFKAYLWINAVKKNRKYISFSTVMENNHIELPSYRQPIMQYVEFIHVFGILVFKRLHNRIKSRKLLDL